MTEEFIAWTVIAVLTAVLVAVLVGTRWFRAAIGPTRVDPAELILPWGGAVFMGVLAWLGSQVIYVGFVTASRVPTSQPTTQPTKFDFQPHELAIASTVPPLLGAVTMLLFAAGAPGWLKKIGLAANKLPAGALQAVVGLGLAYPLVFWVLQAMERVYRVIEFEHPREHELLQKLSEDPTGPTRWAMFAGAIVAAPLFEELLFRGGLQTIFRWFLTRVAGREIALVAWVPIVVVSAAFAMIHALWMAPAIFVLSLCLGYLYERTGNLWACILMHAMFNALNTVFYLNQ